MTCTICILAPSFLKGGTDAFRIYDALSIWKGGISETLRLYFSHVFFVVYFLFSNKTISYGDAFINNVFKLYSSAANFIFFPRTAWTSVIWIEFSKWSYNRISFYRPSSIAVCPRYLIKRVFCIILSI